MIKNNLGPGKKMWGTGKSLREGSDGRKTKRTDEERASVVHETTFAFVAESGKEKKYEN